MLSRYLFTSVLLIILALALALPSAALAQDAEEEIEPCPAGITLELPATGISLEAITTTANLDTVLCNGTDRAMLINLEASGMPADWTAKFRPRVGSFLITSILLDAGQRTDLQLRIRGPRDQSAADFTLTMQATSGSGDVLVEKTLRVQRVEGEPADPGQVTVTASYPFLSGPTSTLFEFEMAVVNNTPEDVSLNLGALFPQGWTVQFLPAFGAERLITNVSIVAQLNQRIKVRVFPPALAPAGDYPILVRMSDEEEIYVKEVPLQVTLTGAFDVFMTTPDGRLNVNADAGSAQAATVRMVNTGTADIENLALSSDTPAGWEIEYQTANVESLPVNNRIDVPLTITPPGDAVPGDYLVTLRVRNNDVQDQVSLRITVEKSTIWQWVGIGILVAVIIALVGMFVRLGRR
jgi:uncharacterized membrane protein